MPLLLFLLGIAVVFVLLDAAAGSWGVDSRDGSVDPRQPAPGLYVR